MLIVLALVSAVLGAPMTVLAAQVPAGAVAAAAGDRRETDTVLVSVQGETNLTTEFIAAFKREASERGLTVRIVERRDDTRDYGIILAQESSMGGAAAATIALNRDGDVVASVVRSGRLSGKGAMNACAKELAKRLAVLRR